MPRMNVGFAEVVFLAPKLELPIGYSSSVCTQFDRGIVLELHLHVLCLPRYPPRILEWKVFLK